MKTHEEAAARDFRRNLSRHLGAAEHGGKSTIITKNGHRAAVLVPYVSLVELAAELRHRFATGTDIGRQIRMLEQLTTPGAPGA